MVKRLTSVAVLLVLVLLPACGGTGTTGVPTPTGAVKPVSTRTAPTATTGGGVAAATPLPTLTGPQLLQKLSPSVVLIRAAFPPDALSSNASFGSGSGIVMSSDGYILTNAHVVDGAAAITVSASGSTEQRSARLVALSECDDLAVLKVDNTQGLVPATFGKSSDQQAGENVAVIGYPLGDSFGDTAVIAQGSISQLNVTTIAPYQNMIRVDATINPGNSGGALVNMQGQVIGIPTLNEVVANATNTGFAIAIDQAQSVIPTLLKGHNPLYLGMNLIDNTFSNYFGTSNGVVVQAVSPDSPAAAAGVQQAYLLQSVDNVPVNSKGDVCLILRSHQDGFSLPVQFLNIAQNQSQSQLIQGQITIGQAKSTDSVKVVQTGPLPGQTPTATAPTPTPAPTATGGTANVKTWDFSSDNGDWPTGDTSTTSVSISGGTYNVTFKQAGYYDVRTPKSFSPTGDQAIAADVNLKAGYAGVVVRFSSTSDNKWSYYDCWIDGSGEYGCRVDVQDQFTVLVPTTTSSAIKNGQVNRLELDASGTSFDFYINGTKVTSFSDSHIQSGVVGLEAGSNKGQTPGSVSFGNVAATPAQ